MIKKILISLLFLITCITISAQSNAITASEDTTINVIAWFNKNDTTEYTYKKQVTVINDDDTTRTNSIEHNFRSTSSTPHSTATVCNTRRCHGRPTTSRTL